jgi:hypothetical protein
LKNYCSLGILAKGKIPLYYKTSGFADVWLVYDALSKRKIACKVEKTGIKYPLLENEISILRFLTKIEG